MVLVNKISGVVDQHHYYGFALSNSRFAPVARNKVASHLFLSAQPPLLS